MRREDLLNVTEVCMYIGRSPHTINYWYKWKQENPNSELAKLLPDYIQDGNRQTRYWRREDLWRLIEFKQRVPQGRAGIMKQTIEAYYHGGKKSADIRDIDTTICVKQTGT